MYIRTRLLEESIFSSLPHYSDTYEPAKRFGENCTNVAAPVYVLHCILCNTDDRLMDNSLGLLLLNTMMLNNPHRHSTLHGNFYPVLLYGRSLQHLPLERWENHIEHNEGHT
ncbi:hypothetical protein EVAR_21838_1 [Eumeta japonica]|uniref:Uncharacterized protein n=1 Tax=Eumeta variegata TaxID=151549 RepID=A0A4C1VA45_EUMVA|nr:hypothetical protein EVAR_21838_1 [Eumeta japonica]